MKTRKLGQALSIVVLLFAVNFFSNCTGGNPSEEGYSGETRISGTLSGGAGEVLRSESNASSAAHAPLANHKLYCVTVQEPIVEGSGVADASGNVTVVLSIKSGKIACSVLDPQGNRIAKLIFSDAAGTNQSQAISGGGDINLSIITVNPATGEAHAKIPDKVTIVAVTLPKTAITSKPSTPTSSQSAEFQFNCDQGNCTFECNLDSEGRSSCTSPKTYHNLSVASHSFQVRAKNSDGYIDPTPAIYTWTITQPPVSRGSWVEISTTDEPSFRTAETAIWTGQDMIVWGGKDFLFFNTGGKYCPTTDSWVATSTTDAPQERAYHTAVWTGNVMIVWGGSSGAWHLNTGSRYNPATDSWNATTTTNAPSTRAYHAAVWTGTKMIVWGDSNSNTGGIYNPLTNSWTATTITNAPDARTFPTAVWTGEEMIVWGGEYYSGEWYYVNTGGRYDPDTDSWTATSTTNAPQGRTQHNAVWTGTEMIVWGGGYNTGGRYNPLTDSWMATTTINAPSGTSANTAVWTGIEMIVWGGYPTTNTGGLYNPSTDSWAATTTTNAPMARIHHKAVWSGTEMIIWGGGGSGGKYTP